jgi:phosphotriesterase-related protein
MIRTFLSNKCILLFLLVVPFQAISQRGTIVTVTGSIKSTEMGFSLIHEHVVTNFIGADKVTLPPDGIDSTARKLLPHFIALKKRGIQSLVECTPNYIGRDVRLLKRIAELSGINIITNTGYYAAVNKRYLPPSAFTDDVETIANKWEREFLEGIEATGIRPGFMKLGVDNGPLDSVEQKLLRAAINVSKTTQLVIAVHTGDGAAALSELEIIEKENWKAEKLIWVHAQNGTDEERKIMAQKGAWVSLDGVSERTVEQYLSSLLYMKRNGLLHRVLLSHDDGWSVLVNGSYEALDLFKNGNQKPYTTISEKLLPKLRANGFTKSDINLIMVENPSKAFSL